MKEREIQFGDFVFELFEDLPRVLKVLDVTDDVITAETEFGSLIAHKANFRLASEEEIETYKS